MSYNQHNLHQQMFKEDSGSLGKAFEMAIKEALTSDSWKKRQADFNGKVSSNNRVGDKDIYVNKKKVTVEIKTGCGVLSYEAHEDMEISDILKGVDYIVYCPEVNAHQTAEEQGFVFSRDEFIGFLEGYPSMTRFKVSTQGHLTMTIQSFKNSKKKSDYVWDACYNQPTVADWLAEIRA